MTRALRHLNFLVVVFFFAAMPAMAQEGDASPADSPTGWIFRWLNFAIVFGAIVYFAVKYGGPSFRANAESISTKIAEGTRAREAMMRKKILLKLKTTSCDSRLCLRGQ